MRAAKDAVVPPATYVYDFPRIEHASVASYDYDVPHGGPTRRSAALVGRICTYDVPPNRVAGEMR